MNTQPSETTSPVVLEIAKASLKCFREILNTKDFDPEKAVHEIYAKVQQFVDPLERELNEANKRIDTVENLGLGTIEEVGNELRYIAELLCPEYEGEDSVHNFVEQLQATNERLEKELSELRRDKARLDWCENNLPNISSGARWRVWDDGVYKRFYTNHTNLRVAIDEAMNQKG